VGDGGSVEAESGGAHGHCLRVTAGAPGSWAARARPRSELPGERPTVPKAAVAAAAEQSRRVTEMQTEPSCAGGRGGGGGGGAAGGGAGRRRGRRGRARWPRPGPRWRHLPGQGAGQLSRLLASGPRRGPRPRSPARPSVNNPP
jgi:hypothetical protein